MLLNTRTRVIGFVHGAVLQGERQVRLRKWLRYFAFHVMRGLGTEHVSTRVLDHEMLLDLQNGGISSQLFVNQIREPEHTQLIQEMVHEGDAVLDLGANIGYYTLLMGRLVGLRGRVHAVEPDLRNLPLLRANVALSGMDKTVEIFPLAVGPEEGEAQFLQASATNLSRLVTDSKLEEIQGSHLLLQRTEQITLDALGEIVGKVRLIRMDVEGAEASILGPNGQGYLQSLEAGAILFIELHPEAYGDKNPFEDVLDGLEDIGFSEAEVVSALSAPPGAFSGFGLKPSKIFRSDQGERGLYRVTDFDTLKSLTTSIPKVSRYLILRKILPALQNDCAVVSPSAN